MKILLNATIVFDAVMVFLRSREDSGACIVEFIENELFRQAGMCGG